MKSRNRLLFAPVLLAPLTALFLSAPAAAQTTVDPADKYSWGANVGWLNWEGDVANGAVFEPMYASGYVWMANCGWVHLGDGSPDNAVAYSNTTATDYGVNVDATGDPTCFLLSGFAWGANIGWISFDVPAPDNPRIDKATGIMEGYAWGANIGWLPLNSFPTAVVNSGLTAVPTPTPSPFPTTTPSPSAFPTATPSPSAVPTLTPTLTPTATPACCPGDANNSGGAVNAQDFLAVQANFGLDNGVGGLGDANCSGGAVNAQDFLAVQANFGLPCP